MSDPPMITAEALVKSFGSTVALAG
ncbi:MAG: hypothetical protein QOJ01_1380, partial [Solirubrobacterales bacterium]|nr:hypothetical protein [Solirubrobacterales bacterium]